MAAGVGNTFTYDDVARREDLLDIITNLHPSEQQLFSGLGVGQAKDIFHIWLIDTLASIKTNAFVEGVDACYADRTDPARLSNVCQIFRVGYSVSDTERIVNKAGFQDRYEREARKAMKEFGNDVEFALMRGSIACGTGSAARQLRGIKNSLSLVTSQSGTSISETMLNDYFQLVWDNGTEVNAVYGDMYLKRKISAFTGGATKEVEVEDRRLVNAVDVYQADAAKMVKLFAHRYVTIGGDTNHDIVGLNEDLFRVAYLRRPDVRELAKTGDATNGEFFGELTLENLHYNAGFLGKAHL